MPDRRRSGRGARRDLRARGRQGEDAAAAYLAKLGFRIVARNVHVRSSEIDLIALDGRTLCFVEVRLRSSNHFGSPEESVDRRKRRQLVRGARLVLARGDLPRFESVRFDVVGVDLSSGTPRIRFTRDAFHLGDL